ncbi:MAG: hypothetical protein SP1CHLAM42_14450 [Chlamydiales bacterium]|nr:hypothetical protein [Chlamydiales bacterium]
MTLNTLTLDISDRSAYFPNYCHELFEAKKSLIAAEELFLSLDTDPTFQCILPNSLYFKTIDAGSIEPATAR